jgi:proline iminopeptidase
MALVGYQAEVRPRLRGWGATDHERREPLPGDDLVHGRYQSTHAITIDTPPAQVWPWIVQLGYGRGGWYSYDRLEQAVGGSSPTCRGWRSATPCC